MGRDADRNPVAEQRLEDRRQVDAGQVATDDQGGALEAGDGEATVKRYYRERDGRVRLQPANEALAPMYFDRTDDIRIEGVVVGVMSPIARSSASRVILPLATDDS